MKNSIHLYSLLLFFIILNSNLNAQSPSLHWAKQLKGSDTKVMTGMAIDKFGNIYSCGTFTGTIDFDPGQGVYNLSSNNLIDDIYIQKLDEFGNHLWTLQFQGKSHSSVKGIVCDTNGFVHVIGTASDSIDFDPGPNTKYLNSNTPLYVLKLTPSANLVWVKGYDGLDPKAIALDSRQNIIVTGTYKDSIHLNPDSGNFILRNSSNRHISFLMKLNSLGQTQWASEIERATTVNNGNFYIDNLTCDNQGNIYFTVSNMRNNAVYRRGSQFSNVGYTPWATALVKLDSNGFHSWNVYFKGVNSGTGILVTGLKIDNSNNILLSGTFGSAVDIDPDPAIFDYRYDVDFNNEIALIKLNNLGTMLWAHTFGGPSQGCPTFPFQPCLSYNGEKTFDMAVDAQDNIYLVGMFLDSVDFDPSANNYFLYNDSTPDGFIQKFNPNGNLLYANNYNVKHNLFSTDFVRTKHTGEVYIGGHFEGQVDFDFNSGVTHLNSTGQSDIFIQKLVPTPVGIEESNEGRSNSFSIYPNPGKGHFTLQFEQSNEQRFIRLLDLQGREIWNKTYAGGIITLQVDGPQGIYLLEVLDSRGNRKVKKVIKQ